MNDNIANDGFNAFAITKTRNTTMLKYQVQ